MKKGSSTFHKELSRFKLSEREHLNLALFLIHHRGWAMRHWFPLELVIEKSLRRLRFDFRYMSKFDPHPVYEIVMYLTRTSPNTQADAERAVRWAFACAGYKVERKWVTAQLRGSRVKVGVLLTDSRPHRATTKPKCGAKG
jgi:hypothetical protein